MKILSYLVFFYIVGLLVIEAVMLHSSTISPDAANALYHPTSGIQEYVDIVSFILIVLILWSCTLQISCYLFKMPRREEGRQYILVCCFPVIFGLAMGWAGLHVLHSDPVILAVLDSLKEATCLMFCLCFSNLCSIYLKIHYNSKHPNLFLGTVQASTEHLWIVHRFLPNQVRLGPTVLNLLRAVVLQSVLVNLFILLLKIFAPRFACDEWIYLGLMFVSKSLAHMVFDVLCHAYAALLVQFDRRHQFIERKEYVEKLMFVLFWQGDVFLVVGLLFHHYVDLIVACESFLLLFEAAMMVSYHFAFLPGLNYANSQNRRTNMGAAPGCLPVTNLQQSSVRTRSPWRF